MTTFGVPAQWDLLGGADDFVPSAPSVPQPGLKVQKGATSANRPFRFKPRGPAPGTPPRVPPGAPGARATNFAEEDQDQVQDQYRGISGSPDVRQPAVSSKPRFYQILGRDPAPRADDFRLPGVRRAGAFSGMMSGGGARRNRPVAKFSSLLEGVPNAGLAEVGRHMRNFHLGDLSGRPGGLSFRVDLQGTKTARPISGAGDIHPVEVAGATASQQSAAEIDEIKALLQIVSEECSADRDEIGPNADVHMGEDQDDAAFTGNQASSGGVRFRVDVEASGNNRAATASSARQTATPLSVRSPETLLRRLAQQQKFSGDTFSLLFAVEHDGVAHWLSDAVFSYLSTEQKNPSILSLVYVRLLSNRIEEAMSVLLTQEDSKCAGGDPRNQQTPAEQPQHYDRLLAMITSLAPAAAPHSCQQRKYMADQVAKWEEEGVDELMPTELWRIYELLAGRMGSASGENSTVPREQGAGIGKGVDRHWLVLLAKHFWYSKAERGIGEDSSSSLFPERGELLRLQRSLVFVKDQLKHITEEAGREEEDHQFSLLSSLVARRLLEGPLSKPAGAAEESESLVERLTSLSGIASAQSCGAAVAWGLGVVLRGMGHCGRQRESDSSFTRMSERLIATLGRAGEPEFAVFVAQWIPVEAVRSRILNSLLFQHAFPVEGAGYERLTQLWKVDAVVLLDAQQRRSEAAGDYLVAADLLHQRIQLLLSRDENEDASQLVQSLIALLTHRIAPVVVNSLVSRAIWDAGEGGTGMMVVLQGRADVAPKGQLVEWLAEKLEFCGEQLPRFCGEMVYELVAQYRAHEAGQEMGAGGGSREAFLVPADMFAAVAHCSTTPGLFPSGSAAEADLEWSTKRTAAVQSFGVHY